MASNTVIQTNVLALNANRNLGMVGAKQTKASQKLSSGYKVNSAADDAAGLAISEKMRSQIRGLDMASKNSQDAVSLIQTAEGGMQEIDNMVQRIRELVVYASNDTQDPNNGGKGPNDDISGIQAGDRQKIQDEINTLMKEIDSMAGRVEFNKKKLISGDFAADGKKVNASAVDSAVAAAVVTAVSDAYTLAAADGTLASEQADVLSDMKADTTTDYGAAAAKYEELSDSQVAASDEITATSDARKAASDLLSDATSDYNVADSDNTVAGSDLNVALSDLSDAQVLVDAAGPKPYNSMSDIASDFTKITSDLGKALSDNGASSDVMSDYSKIVKTATDDFAVNLGTLNDGGTVASSDTSDISDMVSDMAKVVADIKGASGVAGSDLSDAIASSLVTTSIADSMSDFMLSAGYSDKLSDANANVGKLGANAIDKGKLADSQKKVEEKTALSDTASDNLVTASDNRSDVTITHSDAVVSHTGAIAKEEIYSDAASDAGSDLTVEEAAATVIASDTAVANVKSDLAISEESDFRESAAYDKIVADQSSDVVGGDELYFQVGANAGQGWTLNIANVSCEGLGLATGAIEEDGISDQASGNIDSDNLINVLEMTGEGDVSALLDKIDAALTMVTTERSKLGAAQNRLEYTDNSLQITSENLSAAESRIRDTDMAKEMMKLTQANILQQAATSMLAQANQAPQQVLQLLQ